MTGAEVTHVPLRAPEWTFGVQQRPGPWRCGRPKVHGRGPCKATPLFGIAACKNHATYAEMSAYFAHQRQAAIVHAAIMGPPPRISPYPACWFWPLPTEQVDLFDWQDLRCAACGHRPNRLVEDHDHDTGWIRGWLCQSCNLREAGAVRGDPFPIDRRLVRYRRLNPARMLGVWEHYVHPLHGVDRGRLGGAATRRAHPVNRAGRVLIDNELLHLVTSPADLIDDLFEQALTDLNPPIGDHP